MKTAVYLGVAAIYKTAIRKSGNSLELSSQTESRKRETLAFVGPRMLLDTFFLPSFQVSALNDTSKFSEEETYRAIHQEPKTITFRCNLPMWLYHATFSLHLFRARASYATCLAERILPLEEETEMGTLSHKSASAVAHPNFPEPR